MNRRLLFATTLLLSGFSLAGCELYDPGLIDVDGPGGGCGDGVGLIPCKVPDTSSPDDDMAVSFALTGVQLNQSTGGEWRDIGLSLDGVDSQAPDFIGDCTPNSDAPDGTNGIDNQFGGRLWEVIRSALPTLECEVNAAHMSGHGSLIITVSDWNGELDDSQVRINIQPSLDATTDTLTETDCEDVILVGDSDANGEIERYELETGDGMTLRPNPLMNGSDYVCLNANGTTTGQPGAPPKVEDINAYVAGGKIVFTLTPGSNFILYSDRSSVSILLNQGTMVMPMSSDFLRIEGGTVGGRFPLNALSQVGPEIGICDPSGLQEQYETFVDILADFDERADGSSLCNALSVGVAFDGVRVNVAGTSPTSAAPFYACDGVGPTADIKVEFPVQECCDELGGSETLACNSYWSMMP